jgi:MFS family permease
VLVVSLGRLGDRFGRVRMYNLGFVVFTLASLILTLDPWMGPAEALWLITGRVVQGIGAVFLVANSGAILTDGFPANQLGLALGINNVAGISGAFIGLVLGGLLAPISWRLVRNTRCSACRCSGSRPSPSARSRPSSRPSVGAA